MTDAATAPVQLDDLGSIREIEVRNLAALELAAPKPSG